MKSRAPIVLLTDFGLQDPFVGVLHGVISTLNPTARVIDLCHDVEPQNVLRGAFYLRDSYPYFPLGSIFVCIVDPGVGTRRKILAVKSKHYFFLAPDNGILDLALTREKTFQCRELINPKFFRPKISSTFHGRDILAPAAAHLSRNPKRFNRMGPTSSYSISLKVPSLHREKNMLRGQILYFDRFGNAISNIPRSALSDAVWARTATFVGSQTSPLEISRAYGYFKNGLAALFNSSDYLEIAQKNGSAKNQYALKAGDPIKVKL